MISSRLGLFVGESGARKIVRGSARMALAAWELVFVSAVMQMGLALPMAYYFHRATTIGLPANLIVIPLTQLMMPAAIPALALGYISPWLAKVPVLATRSRSMESREQCAAWERPAYADLRVAMPANPDDGACSDAVLLGDVGRPPKNAL